MIAESRDRSFDLQETHELDQRPCISLCKFTDDICLGCGRSKREIRAWKKLDKDDKRTVLAAALRLIKLGGAGRRKKK
jgi:predicted Fe-S protein YdhL (DUF1289 family)